MTKTQTPAIHQDETLTAVVYFRTDPATAQALEETAERTFRTKSHLLRMLVSQGLAEMNASARPTPTRRLKESGSQ